MRGESDLAVRIYSLAKELKLDSKVLVDLCTKAGVTGKGSALASLTDEEEAKVKAFLAGGAARSAPREPAAPVPPKPVAPVVAAPSAPEPPTFRREDYLAPTGAMSKPPLLAPKSDRPTEIVAKRPAAEPSSRPPVTRSTAPAIRVAPMPTSQQPLTPAAPAEPEPQKPDIKLPADAIRASKAAPIRCKRICASMKPTSARAMRRASPTSSAAQSRPRSRLRSWWTARSGPAAAVAGRRDERTSTERSARAKAAPATTEDDRTLGARALPEPSPRGRRTAARGHRRHR